MLFFLPTGNSEKSFLSWLKANSGMAKAAIARLAFPNRAAKLLGADDDRLK